MFRFLLLVLVILATAANMWLNGPWWLSAVAAAIFAGILPVWRRGGIWFAFLGGLLVWGIYAGYLHWGNEGRLSDRLAVTFGVASGWILVLITALLGGVTTGLGGWFGASLRRAFTT